MKKYIMFVSSIVAVAMLIYYTLPKKHEVPCDYISVKQILTEKFPEYILDKSSDFTDEICLVGKDDSEHCFEYHQESDGVCRMYENYTYGKIVTKTNQLVEVNEYHIDHYNDSIKYSKSLTAPLGVNFLNDLNVVNIKQKLRDNYIRVRYGYLYEDLGDNFYNFVNTNSPIQLQDIVVWIQQNVNTVNKTRVWVYDGIWGTADLSVQKNQFVAGVVVFKDPSKNEITKDDYYCFILLNRAGTDIRNYLIPVSFKTYLSYLRFKQGESDGWNFEEDINGNTDSYLRYIENIAKKMPTDNHFMENDLNYDSVVINLGVIPTLKI